MNDQKTSIQAGDEPPWQQLDPGLAAALAAELGPLADEVIDAIGREIAAYRRPLEGAFGRGIRTGVRQALEQFVDLLGHPQQAPADREVYRALGRGECRAGRSLDTLQAAYRLGARLSWRRLSAVARERGASATAISLLAESIFAYIEQISASSIEGYAQAQAQLAGENDRRRRRLVGTLVSAEEPDEQALRVAAAEAGWSLPDTLAAIVCDLPDGSRLAGLVGAGAIWARVGEVTCVLVGDPDAPGRREQLAAAVGRAGADATLGPTVSARRAAVSFARAREGRALQRRGTLTGAGLVPVSEHLLELLVHRDPLLLDELAALRLDGLSGLPAGSRERLAQTLRSWLDHQGSVPAVAEDLHVHRQTVRYRLGRLRELLGEDLYDPRRRLELELALRAGPGRG